MDQRIHYVRRQLPFRFVTTDDHAAAMRVENAIRRGALAKSPKLNPYW